MQWVLKWMLLWVFQLVYNACGSKCCSECSSEFCNESSSKCCFYFWNLWIKKWNHISDTKLRYIATTIFWIHKLKLQSNSGFRKSSLSAISGWVNCQSSTQYNLEWWWVFIQKWFCTHHPSPPHRNSLNHRFLAALSSSRSYVVTQFLHPFFRVFEVSRVVHESFKDVSSKF